MDRNKPESVEPVAYNYCVSFIDLLGQRDALQGEGLLPEFRSDVDQEAFLRKLRSTIVAIRDLQMSAESMLTEVIKPDPDSTYRKSLHPEEQKIWDEMHKTRVTTQRWSDGLMSFVCLGDKDIKCHMKGIFSILGLAGTLCFLGLAKQRPVRGAIDVGWGAEIYPGELYGAAVARAYELESEIAQYPRILVSIRTVELLKTYDRNPDNDHFTTLNRNLAKLCLSMLSQDADGRWIIDYLGEGFQDAITKSQHREIYTKARDFVTAQLSKYQSSTNTKLAFRYHHLWHYFYNHPLPAS